MLLKKQKTPRGFFKSVSPFKWNILAASGSFVLKPAILLALFPIIVFRFGFVQFIVLLQVWAAFWYLLWIFWSSASFPFPIKILSVFHCETLLSKIFEDPACVTSTPTVSMCESLTELGQMRGKSFCSLASVCCTRLHHIQKLLHHVSS